MIGRERKPARLVGASALLLAFAFGCSEETAGDTGGGSDSSGTGGGNNSINLDGASDGSDSGNDGNGSDGSDGNYSGSFEECVGNSAEPEAVPAVIQILLDTSFSMSWGAPGSDLPKLDDTRAALSAVLDTLPATSAIGFSTYPNVDGGEEGACYDGDDGVPMALLGPEDSEQRGRLAQAIDATEPRGGTPTHMAYLHALELAEAAPLPGQRYVLLITDGTPTFGLACSGTGVSAVPTAGLVLEVEKAMRAGVKTFVVGSPGSEDARDTLSRMATNGGTARAGCADTGPEYCHFDMTESENFQEDLKSALLDIVGQAIRCEYDVPEPPNGQVLDLDLVNVLFTDAAGEAHELAKNLEGEGCDEGWHFSDDDSKVVLCEETCDRVQADSEARLDIVFGCETVTVVK